MRIALLVNEFPSPSETFILDHITGLLDRGHYVRVYAAKSGSAAVVHEAVQKYQLVDRTFYYGSRGAVPPNRLLRVQGAARLLLGGHGRPSAPLWRALDVLRFGRRAASLTLLYEAYGFLCGGESRYDIIHCHYGPNGQLAVRLRELGVLSGRVVTTFHGYDMSAHVRRRGNGAYRRLFELGDLFLPISERWKRELMRLGCREEQIVVHRMGVDTSKCKFRARGPRSDGKTRLLAVGRLVEKKGLRYAVEAVAKLSGRYSGLELEIVGDGPLREHLELLIGELNVGQRCRLLGPKSHEDVVRLMDEADILVAPSVTAAGGDQEGVPMVLMEALAMGLPVLSTRHSGIPELVQDGRSGFLVPEGDLNALAERLEYLISHPEAWAAMGRAGRQFVERHYDLGRANDRLVQLYEGLLRGVPLKQVRGVCLGG